MLHHTLMKHVVAPTPKVTPWMGGGAHPNVLTSAAAGSGTLVTPASHTAPQTPMSETKKSVLKVSEAQKVIDQALDAFEVTTCETHGIFEGL